MLRPLTHFLDYSLRTNRIKANIKTLDVFFEKFGLNFKNYLHLVQLRPK